MTPLDLNFREFQSRVISPSKKVEEHGKHLLSISDFRKKIQYYNQHLCSLAYNSSGEGLHCFGEYGYNDGVGDLFFKKGSPDENPHYHIYLEERQREIARLKGLLDGTTSYFDKLTCFFAETAGQPRFALLELKIQSNAYDVFLAKGGGLVPDHLQGNNTEIDLRPSSAQERKSYNRYLYDYIRELIKEPARHHWVIAENYQGFLFVRAIEAFKKQLRRTFEDKEGLLKTEISRIERKYRFNALPDYIEQLYPYRIENTGLWQAALFNAFVKGYEFDFGRRELSLYEMEAFIHIEEVFAYYKELHRLKTAANKLCDEQPLRLSDTDERFAREFENAKIPFAEVVEQHEPFKAALVRQFAKADLKPCFDLYLADYYSNEELQQGFKAVHQAIPVSGSNEIVAARFVQPSPFETRITELYAEFSVKAAKSELPFQYFCPDIEKTDFVVALREIHNEYEILKKAAFDPATNKYKEAEIRAANVVKFAKRLGNFAQLVLDHLSTYSENILLHLGEAKNEQFEAWNRLKSNFNHEMAKFYSLSVIGSEDSDNPPFNKDSQLIVNIENELAPFQNAFNNEGDYQTAIIAIKDFFETGKKISKSIFVKNGNIRGLAYALGQIWRSQRNDVISYDYLEFYKHTFSIFFNQRIDRKNLFGCNLYKYSISRA